MLQEERKLQRPEPVAPSDFMSRDSSDRFLEKYAEALREKNERIMGRASQYLTGSEYKLLERKLAEEVERISEDTVREDFGGLFGAP